MYTNQDIGDQVRKLAQWYYNRLHQDTRDSGTKYYKFCERICGDGTNDEVSLPKDEEERCRALAFAAHEGGNMLPDDWRYEFLHEALGAITDASNLDEIEMEADVYNSDLMRWLASHGERSGYCDQAASDGLVAENADMITRVQCGQYTEKQEVLGLVLEHLREEASAMEDAEEESATQE